jgi:hypothetical protein
MAGAMSSKDFKVGLMLEGTGTDVNGNTVSGITTTQPAITESSVLLGLDVDSIGFPSLATNQVMDVRSNEGRVATQVDFFHDNTNRVTEFSVSGTLHNSAGHRALFHNIMASVADPVAIAYNHTGSGGIYGTSSDADVSLTVVLVSPDPAHAHNIILRGCFVTSLAISADMGSNGGMYTYSATFSTGKTPLLANTETAVYNKYGGSPISLATAGTKTVDALTVIMSSFGVTIDSPMVYTGVAADGYVAYQRGAETSVTANATCKLDSVSRAIIANYDAGTVVTSGFFAITQGTVTDFSIAIASGALTNATYNEGDIMMLDVEMKALAGASGSVLTVDMA